MPTPNKIAKPAKYVGFGPNKKRFEGNTLFEIYAQAQGQLRPNRKTVEVNLESGARVTASTFAERRAIVQKNGRKMALPAAA